jgi:hypothetical protein
MNNQTVRLCPNQHGLNNIVFGNPAWARVLPEIASQELARAEKDVHERDRLRHLWGDGFAIRFEWARPILEMIPIATNRWLKSCCHRQSLTFHLQPTTHYYRP